MPSVLITGAGRGIGQAVALRQASAGWDVYAGVRDGVSAHRLAAANQRITPVEFDITQQEQIAAVAELLPQNLDAVVNNAGITVLGPVEALSPDDFRRQLEVNLIGQLAVTQAAMPMLRASKGRVVFISSVVGRIAVPLEGAYCASKFALEGLADALRIELRPWHVHVSLVEPGPIDNGRLHEIHDEIDGMQSRMLPQLRDLYAAHTAGLHQMLARLEQQSAPVDSAARAVEKALTARTPRARYLVGSPARQMVAMGAMMPRGLLDAMFCPHGRLAMTCRCGPYRRPPMPRRPDDRPLDRTPGASCV